MTTEQKKVFALMAITIMMLAGIALSPSAVAEDGEDDLPDIDIEISFAHNFGGSGDDIFNTVAATSDGGFVAAGYSAPASFGNGDWTGVTGRGGQDAIIVKFDTNGNVVWKIPFGGSGDDHFKAVTATSDGGFVALGASASESFGTGDWTGVTGRGSQDAIIVKFDAGGNIVWKKNFGGSGNDFPSAVTTTSDGGFVAVLMSNVFGTGDWTGVTGRGSQDAIIVKFDADGNIVWKNNFGGSGDDNFNAVTATPDGGFVALGSSVSISFGNGDWTGVTGRGGVDAIIVKFDADGNIVWKKNFGGSSNDYFRAVTATPDGGFVAVGHSSTASFGNGDWTGVTGRGDNDAIIVKFDADGNVVWKIPFGGSGDDIFNTVAATSDGGFVAAGYSAPASFGNGDWIGVTGQGEQDAIIVKFDADGNVVWKKNFGGSYIYHFNTVTPTSDGRFVAAGYSMDSRHSYTDAIIVKFNTPNNNIDPTDSSTDLTIIVIKSIISLLAVIGVGLLVSQISPLIGISAAALVGLIIAMAWWL